MAWTLGACGAPAANESEKVEPGVLRLGRKCNAASGRLTLDARFDVAGPVVLAIDTQSINEPQAQELVAGSYAISIRPDFRLWRDVAIALLQVEAELVSDAQQRFEITPGASTFVVYEFTVDGERVVFDAD
jgi:hypothetical protein